MALRRKMPFTTSPGREGILRLRSLRALIWQWVVLAFLLAGLCWALAGSPSSAAKNPGCAGAWMTALPDSTHLTAIALPGTHDTMSYSGGALWWAVRPFARTQAADLTTQLRAGVRFLDIRVTPEGGLAHGWVPLSGTLEGVLAEIDQFLERTPSEFVVVRLRDESGAGPEAMKAVLEPALAPLAERLLRAQGDVGVRLDQLTLAELRGGVLILDDAGGSVSNEMGVGAPYGADQQWIQDDFDAPPVEVKAAKVREFISEGERSRFGGNVPHRLRLNYASATDQPKRTPARYARTINAVVEEAVSGARSVPAGVIVLDDPSEAVLSAIIDANANANGNANTLRPRESCSD